MRKLIIAISFIIILATSVYGKDWLRFQADNCHTGSSDVWFSSRDIQEIWTFKPTQHIWSYKRGSNVWSDSACVANLKDSSRVFVGFHNHNLYCLDAKDGGVIWRFIAGGRLNSAPCFAQVDGRPVIYIVSSDRIVYALDANTGDKIWSYETLKWSYTVSDAVTSSPLVVLINDQPRLIFSIWNNDFAPLNNLQQGELFVLNARDGRKIYSKILSTTALNSPAFAYVDETPYIFVSSIDGRIFALDADEGKILWEVTLCMGIHSPVSINAKKNKVQLFVGSRFGNLYCLDAKTGRVIWTKKFGHAIDSTPAISNIDNKTFIYFGCYDRYVYCLEAETGREIWRFKTGDYVVSSCVIAKIANSILVFVHSLDNNLYCLDGLSGSLIWSYDTGRLIWGYHRRGDTNWSSPAISTVSGKPLLVFPSYDGKVYVFSVQENKEQSLSTTYGVERNAGKQESKN